MRAAVLVPGLLIRPGTDEDEPIMVLIVRDSGRDAMEGILDHPLTQLLITALALMAAFLVIKMVASKLPDAPVVTQIKKAIATA